ncbi:hypothetical protein D046_5327A, partial [Vibrio parahaemolyticus V-223/04]
MIYPKIGDAKARAQLEW